MYVQHLCDNHNINKHIYNGKWAKQTENKQSKKVDYRRFYFTEIFSLLNHVIGTIISRKKYYSEKVAIKGIGRGLVWTHDDLLPSSNWLKHDSMLGWSYYCCFVKVFRVVFLRFVNVSFKSCFVDIHAIGIFCLCTNFDLFNNTSNNCLTFIFFINTEFNILVLLSKAGFTITITKIKLYLSCKPN